MPSFSNIGPQNRSNGESGIASRLRVTGRWVAAANATARKATRTLCSSFDWRPRSKVGAKRVFSRRCLVPLWIYAPIFLVGTIKLCREYTPGLLQCRNRTIADSVLRVSRITSAPATNCFVCLISSFRLKILGMTSWGWHVDSHDIAQLSSIEKARKHFFSASA